MKTYGITASLLGYREGGIISIGTQCDNRYVEPLIEEVIKEIERMKTGDFDYDELIDALSSVFGVTAICPVLVLEDLGFEQLKEDVVKYIADVHEEKNFTFKVHSKRARKNYPLNSMEMNCEIGGAILDAYPETRVDVHKPDILFYVEIRERIYVYSIIIPGLGGMPVGTGGKAMLLLSGGLDSPVAGYMVSKRGVKLEATYFHAPPYTSERARQKVVDLAQLISKYTGPIKLHVINFTEIQKAIYEYQYT